MSKAKPMDPEARVLMYVEHVPADGGPTRWGTMTPAQRRRWTRKAHRDGCTWPVTGKGHATPRQRKPRRDG
jgi:hypothetical protein